MATAYTTSAAVLAGLLWMALPNAFITIFFIHVKAYPKGCCERNRKSLHPILVE
jgi:hypothetical protein